MIRSRIYIGDNKGGPVDYTRPVGDTDTPSFDLALAHPGITQVSVRNYDTVTGYEESNVDAIVIRLDAAGRDVSNMPPAPLALTATAKGLDGATVSWLYLGQPGKPEPDSFHIYMNEGDILNYDIDPVLTVPYSPVMGRYTEDLAGLAGGTTYSIGVRAALGFAQEENTAKVQIMAKGSPPLNVTGLVATATFRE
jgi:hypothetical protein